MFASADLMAAMIKDRQQELVTETDRYRLLSSARRARLARRTQPLRTQPGDGGTRVPATAPAAQPVVAAATAKPVVNARNADTLSGCTRSVAPVR